MERKAAIIEKHVVTNIIVIDDDTPKDLYSVELEADSEVSIGWKYDGIKFTAPKQPKPVNTEE